MHWPYRNAGRPKSEGLKSIKEWITWVALRVYWDPRLWWGTMTDCIPESQAACIPLGASSKTKHWAGSGAGSNMLAQSKKISGAGFPFFKSGWDPVTTWWNKSNNSRWFLVFSANVDVLELVATAIGILRSWKCLISLKK